MLPVEQRDEVKRLYFKDGLGYKKIAAATGIQRDTVRAIIVRYKKQIGPSVLEKDGYIGQKPIRKKTEKTPEKIDAERISRLEMEVDLLRNFILEIERR